ncbi:MAG: helix-hairpin-helix domain-containing protein [Syntrophales bacterium LBB04]|nr:helix-hairpin-helix domain-containing protein [Syntrophales bacterium LBB04]
MQITDRQAEGLVALVVLAAMLTICPFRASSFLPSPPAVPFLESERAIAVSLSFEGNEAGVFFLPPGARISNLLVAAGLDPKKYDNKIGVRKIRTGDAIQVNGDSLIAGKMKAAQALALDLPLDINRLSFSELVLVPGIGEKTAEKIIALRDEKGAYHEMEELMEIKGIKEKKLTAFKKYLFVEHAR